MLLVIITGHIDLSVGSVAAFVGAISAIMMVNLTNSVIDSDCYCHSYSGHLSGRGKAFGSLMYEFLRLSLH